MDIHATFLKVRKHFYWLIKAARLKADAPAAEDVPPAAQDEAPAAQDEAPAAPGPRDILLGPLSSLSVIHPANVAYRQLVSDVVLAFQNGSKERKKEVLHRVLQTLQPQGYRFVEESDDEGLWKEVLQDRIEYKVLRYLRDKETRRYNMNMRKARDTQSRTGTATIETTVLQMPRKRKARDMTRSRPGTATSAILTGTGASDAYESTVLQMATNTEPTEPTSPAPAVATENPTEDFLDEVNRQKKSIETVPDNDETELPVVNTMILMLQRFMCNPCLTRDEAIGFRDAKITSSPICYGPAVSGLSGRANHREGSEKTGSEEGAR